MAQVLRQKGDDVVRRFILLLASAVAVATLQAFISPEQASARSSVAATAAHHCGQVRAATSHRSKSPRALSSADISRARRMCTEVHRRVGTVRFWMAPKHRWTLYQHYPNYTCWDLQRKRLLEGPEVLCSIARGAVRASTQKLVKLDKKIRAFLPKMVVDNIDLPYRKFTSCLSAVNYLFRGRWDLPRARMVVRRESSYDPNADNGTHFGCAQESSAMMSAHLKGPWNDAYYNVWVLLWEAEHNGWCNWDIVNYCAPGGEF